MASIEVIVSIILAPVSRRSPPMIFLITMSSRRARSAMLFVGSTNKRIMQVNRDGMALRSFTAKVLYSLRESKKAGCYLNIFPVSLPQKRRSSSASGIPMRLLNALIFSSISK